MKKLAKEKLERAKLQKPRIVKVSKKEEMVIYKGGCCLKCGYNKYLGALHFHHRDPFVKSFAISASSKKTSQEIVEELDKCDLLCANCHAETHGQLRGEQIKAVGPEGACLMCQNFMATHDEFCSKKCLNKYEKDEQYCCFVCEDFGSKSKPCKCRMLAPK